MKPPEIWLEEDGEENNGIVYSARMRIEDEASSFGFTEFQGWHWATKDQSQESIIAHLLENPPSRSGWWFDTPLSHN